MEKNLVLSKNLKFQILAILLALPFALSAVERFLIKPIVLVFSLPSTSSYTLKIGTVCLLLLAGAAFSGQMYGLEITKKVRTYIASMLLVLVGASYFFLFALRTKGLFDDLSVIHLVNWILNVFREEFLLRGIIQTKAEQFFPAKFLGISQAIWISTFTFSIWHLVNLVVWPWHVVAIQMLSCIPSGIILGLIREKTGNTLLTYLLHISGDLIFFSFHTLVFGKLFFSLF